MTNYDIVKSMTKEQLAMFLMRATQCYDLPCMYGIEECKHPNVDNNCSLCIMEWLESEDDESND